MSVLGIDVGNAASVVALARRNVRTLRCAASSRAAADAAHARRASTSC